MSTHFVEILALQTPFSYGVDQANRALVSCNFNAVAYPSADPFEPDVLNYLQGLSLVTPTHDAWIGPTVALPTGPGPYSLLINTGGGMSDISHDEVKYRNLSWQFVIRAADYAAAMSLATRIYDALDGVRDSNLVIE